MSSLGVSRMTTPPQGLSHWQGTELSHQATPLRHIASLVYWRTNNHLHPGKERTMIYIIEGEELNKNYELVATETQLICLAPKSTGSENGW